MNSEINLCENIGQYAVMSMLYEVSASPKPGLVDRFNQGAHKDMDFFTFMASSATLSYYFYKCALKGIEFRDNNYQKLFENIRLIGIEAEKHMFEVTRGVNTHKGLIFSLGIVCAAAASLIMDSRTNYMDIEKICERIIFMVEGLTNRELNFICKNKNLTNGEKLYKKYGFKGIRGEVESGFITVRSYSLPVFKRLKSKGIYSINDIMIQTILHLIEVNEDTNIASRHDRKTLKYAQQYASLVLKAGGILSEKGKEMIYKMDRDFIEQNISPGGSADLLAITVMFDLLSQNW